MSEGLSNTVVLALFLLVTSLSFYYLLDTWSAQNDVTEESVDRQLARLSTSISIVTTAVTSSGSFTFTAQVPNTGDTLVSEFNEMDVLVQYTNCGDSKVVTRLEYPTDWTITMAPDDRDPNVWNPDETATITFSVVDQLQTGSKGTVIVVTPLGIVDSAYFDASSLFCLDYYLHNSPTPPTGPTASQEDLPLTLSWPTATDLYNYDTNRDLKKGLLIEKGGVGANEADPIKYQAWQTVPLPSGLTINGTVTIVFWSTIKDYKLNTAGGATFFLRDYDGADYVDFGSGTLSAADWQGGVSDFVLKSLTIPGVNHTIPKDNQLEVKLIVEPTSGDDIWFAYDTTAHRSGFALP